jgi:hypothetical protein
MGWVIKELPVWTSLKLACFEVRYITSVRKYSSELSLMFAFATIRGDSY